MAKLYTSQKHYNSDSLTWKMKVKNIDAVLNVNIKLSLTNFDGSMLNRFGVPGNNENSKSLILKMNIKDWRFGSSSTVLCLLSNCSLSIRKGKPKWNI